MKHPAGLVLFPDRGPWPEASVGGQREARDTGREPLRARTPRYLVVRLPAFALERCGYDSGDVAACVDDVNKQCSTLLFTVERRGVVHAGVRLVVTLFSDLTAVALQALSVLPTASPAREGHHADSESPWADLGRPSRSVPAARA